MAVRTSFVSPSDPALCLLEVPAAEPGGSADDGVLIFILFLVGVQQQQPATEHTAAAEGDWVHIFSLWKGVYIPSSACLIFVWNTHFLEGTAHENMTTLEGIPRPVIKWRRRISRG